MQCVFFVHVGHNCSMRSDNRFLVVMPCPKVSISIAYGWFSFCELMMCGDVEENPGPSVEEMFQSVMDGQQAIRDDSASLKMCLETREKAVNSFEKRLTQLEENVKANTSAAASLVTTVGKMEETLKLQQGKLIDLEDCSRRSIVIVFWHSRNSQ